MVDRYDSTELSRVSAQGGEDPFGFHQGGKPGDQGTAGGNNPGGTPDWDPYNFNQQPGKPGNDTVPRWTVPKDTTQPRTDVPLPPIPELGKPRELRLQDGAINKFDEQGRCTFTGSADGSKTREVRYNDPTSPEKVTQVIIDRNRVYTRTGDRTWNYEINGQPQGTWHGDVHMSKQGEYSFEDDRRGQQRKFAPNTAEINPPQDADPNVAAQRSRYRVGNCQPCQPYYPQEQQQYRPQQQPQAYYNPEDGQPIQGYRPYSQPVQYQPDNRYYQPVRQQYYDDGRYYDRGGGCYDRGSGCGTYNNNYRSHYGGNGDFGRAVAAGVLNSVMYRSGMGYGGYYGGYGRGYGGYYGGYGGGNIAGAVVGGLIGRAIRGGGRGCRW